MISLGKWRYCKKVMSHQKRTDPKNHLEIFDISWINDKFEPADYRMNDIVLLCGDGNTLQDDVKRFEMFHVEHDLYCVNRSLLFFQRPVNHWAAIDAEESVWLSENMPEGINPPGARMLRHTIGVCNIGYDIMWKVDQKFDNEYQKNIWSGNSGYFGILSALKLGYRKVVVAGMPLNIEPHWYEDQDKPGPNWVGQTYRTWMDFKSTRPESDRVRSMSGYSKFILGEVTEKWLTL